MKMSSVRFWTLSLFVVFILSRAALGVDEKKEVGGSVSFRLSTVGSDLNSITWKQKDPGGTVVKAIEWDKDDGVSTPNPKFIGHTSLDEKTGQITINNLQIVHTGLYTIDVNSKEQAQKFNLIVMVPVPTPEIKREKIKDIHDVAYLRCEYSETIIWRSSDGETLNGSAITPKGESLTVKHEGNQEKYYTCTLKNDVSERTSDRVYERDLFEAASSGGFLWIIPVVLFVILVVVIVIFVVLQKCFNLFDGLKQKPCIGAMVKCLDGKKDDQEAARDSNGGTEAELKSRLKSPSED